MPKGILWIAACLFVFLPSGVLAQEQFPFLGTISGTTANIRSGPHTSFERICQLRQGQDVIVVDKSFSWYKIQLPQEADCFISEQYVKMLSPDILEVTGSRVNVRAAQSDQSSVLGKFNAGTKLKMRQKFPGWIQIEPTSSLSAWIHQDLVSFKSLSVPTVPAVEISALVSGPVSVPAVESQVLPAAGVAAVPEPLPAEAFVAQGVLADSGRIRGHKNIRFKLVSPKRKIQCYLLGESSLFEGLIRRKVRITGQLRKDLESVLRYPVVEVKTVDLLP